MSCCERIPRSRSHGDEFLLQMLKALHITTDNIIITYYMHRYNCMETEIYMVVIISFSKYKIKNIGGTCYGSKETYRKFLYGKGIHIH